jgi:hypothetical protein
MLRRCRQWAQSRDETLPLQLRQAGLVCGEDYDVVQQGVGVRWFVLRKPLTGWISSWYLTPKAVVEDLTQMRRHEASVEETPGGTFYSYDRAPSRVACATRVELPAGSVLEAVADHLSASGALVVEHCLHSDHVERAAPPRASYAWAQRRHAPELQPPAWATVGQQMPETTVWLRQDDALAH